jgi:hypothetical protein
VKDEATITRKAVLATIAAAQAMRDAESMGQIYPDQSIEESAGITDFECKEFLIALLYLGHFSGIIRRSSREWADYQIPICDGSGAMN